MKYLISDNQPCSAWKERKRKKGPVNERGMTSDDALCFERARKKAIGTEIKFSESPLKLGGDFAKVRWKLHFQSIRCSPDLWLKVLAHNYTTADARKSLTQSTNRERERKTCHFDLFRSESQTGEPIFQDDRARKKKPNHKKNKNFQVHLLHISLLSAQKGQTTRKGIEREVLLMPFFAVSINKNVKHMCTYFKWWLLIWKLLRDGKAADEKRK